MELIITAAEWFYLVTKRTRETKQINIQNDYYFSSQNHLNICSFDLENYCQSRGYDFIVKPDHIENMDDRSYGRVLKLVGDPKDLVHFKLKYL